MLAEECGGCLCKLDFGICRDFGLFACEHNYRTRNISGGDNRIDYLCIVFNALNRLNIAERLLCCRIGFSIFHISLKYGCYPALKKFTL